MTIYDSSLTKRDDALVFNQDTVLNIGQGARIRDLLTSAYSNVSFTQDITTEFLDWQYLVPHL